MSGKCTENVLRMQMKMLREVQKGIGECCVDENGVVGNVRGIDMTWSASPNAGGPSWFVYHAQGAQ